MRNLSGSVYVQYEALVLDLLLLKSGSTVAAVKDIIRFCPPILYQKFGSSGLAVPYINQWFCLVFHYQLFKK